MGRTRGSRSSRSGRSASAKQAVANASASGECVELASLIPAAVKLPPMALAQIVETDSTPSTTSPSHADTAVSTPTSHGTMMASAEDMANSTSEEAKQAEKMVDDLLTQSLDEEKCTPSEPEAAPISRSSEPLASLLGPMSGAYRSHLRSRGRLAMQGSNLWRPIAMAEATAESGLTLNDSMSAAQALGLMWQSSSPTSTACTQDAAAVSTAPLQFDPSFIAQTASAGQFWMQPQQLPPVPPPMQDPVMPASPPMQTPTSAGNSCCDVNQLLAIAMPGPLLAGLSNSQLEEQLRAAAAQNDIYYD